MVSQLNQVVPSHLETELTVKNNQLCRENAKALDYLTVKTKLHVFLKSHLQIQSVTFALHAQSNSRSLSKTCLYNQILTYFYFGRVIQTI
jgi:hypothetical protein